MRPAIRRAHKGQFRPIKNKSHHMTSTSLRIAARWKAAGHATTKQTQRAIRAAMFPPRKPATPPRAPAFTLPSMPPAARPLLGPAFTATPAPARFTKLQRQFNAAR